MKKIHFGDSSKSKWYNFLKGKGFYAALALSLVAIGSAAYIAVNRAVDNLTGEIRISTPSGRSEAVTSQEDRIVTGEKTDVPVQKPKSKAQTPKSSKTQAPIKLEFAMPLTGDITNHFSKGELVKSKTLNDWRTHDGIDIGAQLDTPVKSAADGKVVEIKDDKKWGVCIIIDHSDGYEGHYCNLAVTVNVESGQKVRLGDVIGAVGKTAENEIAEDPHLHFGMKKDGKWIDFLDLIEKKE
ncbi:MAG: M23 family metallopeptidase [Oscillospiraceae bacterium]|nr:M23 family metallopeptidase [Oscillospiraceae bacterium]